MFHGPLYDVRTSDESEPDEPLRRTLPGDVRPRIHPLEPCHFWVNAEPAPDRVENGRLGWLRESKFFTHVRFVGLCQDIGQIWGLLLVGRQKHVALHRRIARANFLRSFRLAYVPQRGFVPALVPELPPHREQKLVVLLLSRTASADF